MSTDRPGRGTPQVVLALGVGVLALAVLVAGWFTWRLIDNRNPASGPPSAATGAGDDAEPGLGATLTPREGTPAPQQSGRVGEPVAYLGIYGRGSVTVASYEWSDHGDLPPSDGRSYLNLELRLQTMDGSIIVRPIHFAGYDAKGQEYLPGIGSGKMPQVSDQELTAGQSLRTWVSLDIPRGPTKFVISDEGINPLVSYEIPG